MSCTLKAKSLKTSGHVHWVQGFHSNWKVFFDSFKNKQEATVQKFAAMVVGIQQVDNICNKLDEMSVKLEGPELKDEKWHDS